MTNMSVADDTVAERRAKALAAAVGEMIETLQEISRAAGPWDDDHFTHAANCIEHMKGLAVRILEKYGFEPRGRTGHEMKIPRSRWRV